MKQSDCSVNIIQDSLDEVISYWEELYKRFLSLKRISEEAGKIKVIFICQIYIIAAFLKSYLIIVSL